MQNLKIFVSSPGDVGQERLLASKVITRLQGEFFGRLRLEAVLWEQEPLRSTGHFQEEICRPSDCDIVVCILWSRLGTRLPAGFCRPDGTSYASGTEWEFEDAIQSYQRCGKPDLLVYRKVGDPVVTLTHEDEVLERLRQKKALSAFIDRWFGNPQEGFRAAHHSFPAPEQFEELLETHLRNLLTKKADAPEATGANTHIHAAWYKNSPFRGLGAFDFEDAPVFFGRTRAIAALQQVLLKQLARSCEFVLLLGMSGGGKSSLVRAGLLPTITHPGVVEGVGLWRRAIFRPSDTTSRLCVGLAASLLEPVALPEILDQGFDAEELGGLFETDLPAAIKRLRTAMDKAVEKHQRSEDLQRVPKAKLALFVDQFEEIFTLRRSDAQQREKLVAAMSALARSGFCCVIASMRSDFYPRCAELPELISMKEDGGHYDLQPPSFDEIRQMIERPARAAGLQFELDPKSDQLLSDVIHEAAISNPRCLPLLEFTLEELYLERTKNGVLTFAAYQALGGLEGALGKRAEEVYSTLPSDAQSQFAPLMRMLVTVDLEHGGVLASARVPLAAFDSYPERRQMLDALVAARLLVTDRGNDGSPIVGIAHESLFRYWPRLAQAMADDKEFLNTRARVQAAAELWRQQQHGADYLLPPGKPLAEAEELLALRPDDIDRQDADYVRQSKLSATRARRRRRLIGGSILTAFLATLSVFGINSYVNLQKTRKAEASNLLSLYVAHIGMAQRDWSRGDVSNAVALLNSHRPQPNDAAAGQAHEDLRGFEWYALWRACHENLMLMRNYGVIRSVAFEPAGSRLVTSSFDNNVYVWDIQSETKIAELAGASAPVFAVAFSPDHRHVAGGGFDRNIYVWDLEHVDRPVVLKGHGDVVTSIAFDPQGRRLASAADDDRVLLWNLEAPSTPEVLWQHEKNAHSVAFSSDGKLVASCSGDGTVLIGEPGRPPRALRYQAHEGKEPDLYGLSFDVNGKEIYAGSKDGYVARWDIASQRALPSLPVSARNVSSMAFSHDGKTLMASDEAGFLQVWKREALDSDWKKLARFRAHYSAVYSIAISADDSTLITGSADGSARAWDTTKWQIKARSNMERSYQVLTGFESSVSRLRFAPNSHVLAAGDTQGRVIAWDFSTGARQVLETDPLGKRRDDEKMVYALQFSRDARFLVASMGKWDAPGYQRAWRRDVNGIWRELEFSLPHEKTVTAITFSGDGDRLATSSFDRTVRVFDATAFPKLKDLNVPFRDDALASGKSSSDAQSRLARRPLVHDKWIYDVQFSPRDNVLATASHDRTVKAWDAATGKLLATLPHRAWIYNVAFSQDGSRLATANWDQSIRVFSTETWEQLHEPLFGHTESVNWVAFSCPDGRTLASASSDGNVKLWNVAAGQELLSFEGLPAGSTCSVLFDGPNDQGAGSSAASPMNAIDFSSDGRMLAAACSDKTVKIWWQNGLEVHPNELTPEVRASLIVPSFPLHTAPMGEAF